MLKKAYIVNTACCCHLLDSLKTPIKSETSDLLSEIVFLILDNARSVRLMQKKFFNMSMVSV